MTMPVAFRFSVVALIVALSFGATRWVSAQAVQAPQFPSQQPDSAAPIISGNDIGFRVDRQETQRLGRLTGTWVVRINGQWIEPAASLRGRPLGTR
jgi:hypothetical protein